jgi:hypothetical protein
MDCPSFSDEGGVNSPAPPGKDSEPGAMKDLACCAFEGWVASESMIAVRIEQVVRLVSRLSQEDHRLMKTLA